MAKTPKRKKADDVNASPPKPATSERGWQLPARVEDNLRRAIEACAAKERRKAAPMIVLLLEEALAVRGFWPPQN